MLDVPSPNFDARAAEAEIDMLVIHYTGMPTAGQALARLCDPACRVSCHYVIDTGGQVSRLVDEDERAWHAGVSYWRGHRDINSRSIGIEMVNPGHGPAYCGFPQAQMEVLKTLANDLVRRHPIPPRNVVGHADVAPQRKLDPGELFDWEDLAQDGVGLWPVGGEPVSLSLIEVQKLLGQFGYEVPEDGQDSSETRKVLAAFQRHFRPRRPSGHPDGETAGRLLSLIKQLG